MLFRTLVVVVGLGIVSGCTSEEAADSGTSDLSRALLEVPAGDGSSTAIRQDPNAAEGPAVPLSEVGFNRGSVDAPVKVIEMSDYGCGYCRQFHDETFPTLRTQFIDSGMVEWKFVPYINGMFDNSLAATEAAECTFVQGVAPFEALNERLWGEQPEWKNSGEPEAVIREWVLELGIDMLRFDGCLRNDERIDRIQGSTTLASQIGVRGTPTFIVLGYPPLQGALPLSVFQDVLSAVYAEATGSGQQD